MSDTKRLIEGGGKGIWEATIRVVFQTTNAEVEAPTDSPEFVLSDLMRCLEQHDQVSKIERSSIFELPDADA